MKWALVDRSTQPTNKPKIRFHVVTNLTEMRGNFFNCSAPAARAALITTPAPVTPPKRYPTIGISIVLFWIIGIILFGILFGVFVDLNNGENENVNCEFVNVDMIVNINFCELLHGALSPTPSPLPIPTPTARPTAIEINYSRTLISEQLVFEYVFGNEYDIASNMGNDINNGFIKNFGDNGYYYSLSYPPHTPAPTPSPTFYFNNNDNGLPGNDIVEYIFGIDCYEYGFEYGMYFFGDFSFIFFPKNYSWFSLSL